MSHAQIEAIDRLTASVLALAVTVEMKDSDNVDTATDNVSYRYELFEGTLP